MTKPILRTPRVVFVQTMVPDYRKPFFLGLLAQFGEDLLLLAGSEDWTRDLEHVEDVPLLSVVNRYFVRRRLLWQSGVVRRASVAEVAVLGLNPRILSSWVVLAVRRLRHKRTVLWGHAWPRRGQASRSDRIRGAMRRLADVVIVYTDTEASQLRETAPGANVITAPNALVTKHEIVPAKATYPTDVLFVGRLNASKKPALLLDAFELALPKLTEEVRLVFIGDGPLRGSLERRVSALGLSERVLFKGHVSDVALLRKAYERAVVSVSPGYVGLSIIQSLGYGVPMLVARDEPHAPEIEAVVDGENGTFFASDSPDALASLLVATIADKDAWLARRSRISETVRSTYSVENMVSAFVVALGPNSTSTTSIDERGRHVERESEGAAT